MPSLDQRQQQEARRLSVASSERESLDPQEHWEHVALQSISQQSSYLTSGDGETFQGLLDALSKKYNELAKRNNLLMKEIQFLKAKCNPSIRKIKSSQLPKMEEDKSSDFGVIPDDQIEWGPSMSGATTASIQSACDPSSMAAVIRTPTPASSKDRASPRHQPSAMKPSRGCSKPVDRIERIHSKASVMSCKMQPVFPAWYDPEAISDDHRRSVTPLEEQAVMGLMTRNRVAHEGTPEIARFVLSPVGPLRLLWDVSAMFCLLYDFWSIPIALVFITDKHLPVAMLALDWMLVVFFSIDIFLNFRTGYLVADRIVWNPKLIVGHYLRTWFLIDAVATIPWDKIFDAMTSHGGDYSAIAMVRTCKVAKALKTIRFLRFAHASRLVKGMGVSKHLNRLYAVCCSFLNPMQVLVVFLLAAHITGSIWAAAQPNFKATADLEDAFRMYYQSFWWAFMALTGGTMGGTQSDSYRPLLWLVDMLVSVERICLIVWIFAYGSLCFAMNFQDRVRIMKAKADATNYLRKRNVSVATQIQVLFNIWETGKTKVKRNRFEEIIFSGVPHELQRTICEELWTGPLLSLGLIMHVSHWHEDLVAELALVAREEVFASKSIIFQEANAAIAAYCIMDGSISVFSSISEHHIPDFTSGMWLGEKALVNPMLRRSGTAVCKTICTVMCIHGEAFHTVLSSLGVTEDFKEFCNEFLWRGLCGRCGLLADHFTSECPLADPSVKRFRVSQDSMASASPTYKRSTIMDIAASITMKGVDMEMVSIRRLDKKLRQFLHVQHLEWLEPALLNLGIVELDMLHKVDMFTLRGQLDLISNEPLVLTEDAERALSPTAVDKFLKALHKQTGDVVSLNVGRSQHYLFLSHFKMEAGTEAALIRNELEKMIDKDPGSPANQLSSPIFLDSEDLTNLTLLQTRVRQSHNLALLLTKSVLCRPWVLVELATAYEAGVHVIPVLLLRGFDQFEFPDEEFYNSVRDGSLLGESGCEVLRELGIDASRMEQAIRATFQRIAVPYSPHRPESIRKSELQSLFKHCKLKRAFLSDVSQRISTV